MPRHAVRPRISPVARVMAGIDEEPSDLLAEGAFEWASPFETKTTKTEERPLSPYWQAVKDELIANPGKWARVAEIDAGNPRVVASRVGRVKTLLINRKIRLTSDQPFEIRQRKIGNVVHVFARLKEGAKP